VQAGSGGTVMGRLRVDPERNVVLQEVVLPISAVKVLCTARCALARDADSGLSVCFKHSVALSFQFSCSGGHCFLFM
jgi:hypothetical protein